MLTSDSVEPSARCAATWSFSGSAWRPYRSRAFSCCWSRSRKSAPAPARNTARPTTTANETMRRARRLPGILFHHQLVADAPDGLDLHARFPELLAEPGDVHVDGARVTVIVGAPD